MKLFSGSQHFHRCDWSLLSETNDKTVGQPNVMDSMSKISWKLIEKVIPAIKQKIAV